MHLAQKIARLSVLLTKLLYKIASIIKSISSASQDSRESSVMFVSISNDNSSRTQMELEGSRLSCSLLNNKNIHAEMLE